MKIAIIGGGNMGGAMAGGFASGNLVAPQDITVADLSTQTLERIQAANPEINTTTSNQEAVLDADLIILAVKPWLMEEVLTNLRPSLNYDRQTVASVAAGISFDALAKMLDTGNGKIPALLRIVPNTAVSVGESMTFIASKNASGGLMKQVSALFSELGSVMTVDEAMVPAATSLASCGIAFALQYMNASMQGAILLGFSEEEARAIVMQTVRGALQVMEANDSMPQPEIDKVTTPGGVTLKGLKAMADAGFAEAVIAGLNESR